jgi:hypothetical protein
MHVALALDLLIEAVVGGCRHIGKVIGAGRVIVTQKKNKPAAPIPGLWLIRRCDRCGERFSRSSDRLDEQTAEEKTA